MLYFRSASTAGQERINARLEEGENDTLVGRWMDGLWDDLKAPVRDAGHGNQLNTFPVPQPVWDFAVSGYRLLPRWIEGRVGLPATLALVRELRDVAARIAELIHRFDEADLVLADTLADTITRDDLGFADEPVQPVEEEA